MNKTDMITFSVCCGDDVVSNYCQKCGMGTSKMYIDQEGNEVRPRLNRDKVLGLFATRDYISTRILMDGFGSSMKTSSTYLRNLVKIGILEAQDGHNNSRWYYLVDKKISAKTVIMRVIRSWQEKDHPNLKNIPEFWGGTRRGGSGHLSAIKLFVQELVELGLIKE